MPKQRRVTGSLLAGFTGHKKSHALRGFFYGARRTVQTYSAAITATSANAEMVSDQ